MSCLDNGRYTVASGATGLIRACLEDSVKYAHSRFDFRQPIAKTPVDPAEDRVHAAVVRRGQDARAAGGLDEKHGTAQHRETSVAKWYATDHSVKAALEAIQVHGAYGYSDEYDVERYLRNAKGAVIYEGTSEIHQLMQAEYALGFRTDRPLRCELPAYDAEILGRRPGKAVPA